MATHSVPLMPLYIGGDAPMNQMPFPDVPLRFILFPKERQTEAYFQLHVPSEYASGAKLGMIYDTLDGEAGDIRGTIEVMAVSDGEDASADSFDTANAYTETVEGTVGETNLIETTLTNFDSGADLDLLIIRIRRTPAHASDTLDADMRLLDAWLDMTVE